MKRFLLLSYCLGIYLLPSLTGRGGGEGLLFAQNVFSDLKQNTTFSGYIIGQATANDQHGNDIQTDAQLRLVRVAASGKVLDFGYQLQVQLNGQNNDARGNAPRIVDAWVEWQKLDYLRVKFGQFKRAFTIENPIHPWLTGPGSYSQLTNKLAGMNDRVGEHASNGRDFGLQLQGDLLPVGEDRHKLLHYQLGAYNGQGINRGDKNTRKDVMGGLFVSPVKELQLAVFGWDGNYVQDGLTVDRIRWGVSAQYEGPVMARAEYVHSVGRKITTAGGTPAISGGDRADGWYALLGVPVCDKVTLWGRYDVYRDEKSWETSRNLYVLAADYNFHKNLKLQLNYTRVNDRAVNTAGGDGDYNLLDLQLYVRF